MIYGYLATALLSAVMAFGGGWKINQWRHDANEKDHIALHAAQERDLHVLEQKRSRHILDAVNASRASEAVLRADATRSRDALVGLRNSSASALSYARGSLDACLVAATTYDELFLASSARYTELAEKAQRHVIDIETREIAWPR